MSAAGATGLVVAACAVACLACLWAARSGNRQLWIGVGAVTAAFALHKALHGQDLVIARFEHLARADGWYGVRRGPQWIVTTGVALLAAAVMLGRRDTRPGPALIAAALAVALVAYALIGMVSLHAWDRLVSRTVGDVAIYTMIEVALPLAIALCALAASGRKRRERAG